MRKIYNIVMLLACLTFFWACEIDRSDHPVALTPDSFVLNTPIYVSGVYDLRNTETILLTTSQPDFGFTAATIYRVQISIQSSFQDFVTLPVSYTSTRMQVSATDIALALVGLLGVSDESEFDFSTPFPVYVRLSAELVNDGRQVLSNIIELPKVKSYFALDPMTMPENMYLIGNVTDWSWGSATEMVPVWGSEGKFWAVQYLGKMGDNNAEIKFNTAKDWDGGEFGMSANIDDASVALAGISGDGNIVIGNPGWYIVVVTTEISGRDYIYQVQFLEPNVYLFGPAAGGKWGPSDEQLFTVPALSLGADADFVSPAFIENDEIRACVILPNEDWWHSEFLVFGTELIYRATGNDQERVSGSVGQKLYINFTKGTGKIQ